MNNSPISTQQRECGYRWSSLKTLEPRSPLADSSAGFGNIANLYQDTVHICHTYMSMLLSNTLILICLWICKVPATYVGGLLCLCIYYRVLHPGGRMPNPGHSASILWTQELIWSANIYQLLVLNGEILYCHSVPFLEQIWDHFMMWLHHHIITSKNCNCRTVWQMSSLVFGWKNTCAQLFWTNFISFLSLKSPKQYFFSKAVQCDIPFFSGFPTFGQESLAGGTACFLLLFRHKLITILRILLQL